MIACLAAGILLLAGPGWALLALGVLVEAAWPREQPAWLPAVQERARVGWAAVRAAPRRALAAVTMTAAVAAVPAGVLLLGGAGAALVAGGVLAAGLGLLLGWNS